MQIDKETVLRFIRDRGDSAKADQASEQLPQQVDTERDAGLLQRFGVDPQDLMSKFGGGVAKGGRRPTPKRW